MLLAGDTCSNTSPEIGPLPKGFVGDTTGWGDDYNLGNEPAPCAGGGTQYGMTGLGDDIVYLVATDVDCQLEVAMGPTGADDLALYVLSPTCYDVDGGCVRVSDGGGVGIAEVITFTAAAQQPHYVIVDGYNNDNGPFNLEISELSATGCQLVDPYGALGNWVWEDANSDGIQTPGEQGIANVTVNLYVCAGGFVTSTKSLPDGIYQFDQLVPGDYVVEFILPQDYGFSPRHQGTDDTADSDADPATGWTICTVLDAGEEDLSWDAGMVQEGPRFSLGGWVWDDLDRDGIQDAGEPGEMGVFVDLLADPGTGACHGSVLATEVSGPVGHYQFNSLDTGTYCLYFYNIPTDYAFSPQDQGSTDWLDSDANEFGEILNIVLSGNDLEQDCGIHALMATYLPAVFRG
jgi:hypothetical protein